MYSPLHLVTFIKDLLREMFNEYGGDKYNTDTMMITTANDTHHLSRTQQFPRVIIQRGPTFLGSQFITNNMEYTTGLGVPSGDKEFYRQDVSGSLNIIVEARNEGTAEELGEILRRFICWSKPFIETRFGFQAFAKQFQLSQCDMSVEDDEVFKIYISIPYIVEDRWERGGDLVRLNHVFQRLDRS